MQKKGKNALKKNLYTMKCVSGYYFLVISFCTLMGGGVDSFFFSLGLLLLLLILGPMVLDIRLIFEIKFWCIFPCRLFVIASDNNFNLLEEKLPLLFVPRPVFVPYLSFLISF